MVDIVLMARLRHGDGPPRDYTKTVSWPAVPRVGDLLKIPFPWDEEQEVMAVVWDATDGTPWIGLPDLDLQHDVDLPYVRQMLEGDGWRTAGS